MKTVRFSQVVKSAGRPVTHLQLTPAKKDAELQRAMKSNRLMTINQETVGHTADFGEIGYDAAARGELLVFPRSLAKYKGRRVVGIKYDLLDRKEEKAARSKGGHHRDHVKGNTERSSNRGSRKTAAKGRTHNRAPEASKPTQAIISFPRSTSKSGESPESRLKLAEKAIKRALRALEQGKQVHAYNALKHYGDEV